MYMVCPYNMTCTLKGMACRRLFPFTFHENLAIATAIYRSPEDLWAPKSPQSLKKVFPGLPTRNVQKVSKRSQRIQKKVKKVSKSGFGIFSTLFFFDTFCTSRAGRPGKTFLRLFGDFGAPGCGAPVYGDCNCSEKQAERKNWYILVWAEWGSEFGGDVVFCGRRPDHISLKA